MGGSSKNANLELPKLKNSERMAVIVEGRQGRKDTWCLSDSAKGSSEEGEKEWLSDSTTNISTL